MRAIPATLDQLKSLIASTNWFSKIGELDYAGQTGFIQLPNLEAWRNTTGLLTHEPVPRLLDEGMEWLPTNRDMDDPVHGKSLKDRSTAMDKEREFVSLAMDVYKTAFVALRSFQGHELLKINSHDFNEAARGAALFCARQAAYEILLEEPGFWCRMIDIYHAGHWPIGIMPDRSLVVI